MYTIDNFKEDIFFLEKYNIVYNNSLQEFNNYLNNYYLDSKIFNIVDYCNLCLNDTRQLLKDIKLQEILLLNKDNKYENLIKEYNEQVIIYNNIKNDLKESLDIITKQINHLLIPLQDILSTYFLLLESNELEVNNIITETSKIIIKEKIDLKEIDDLLSILYSYDNIFINDFVDRVNNKTKELNLKEYVSGIEVYEEKSEVEYEVPPINDIIKTIKERADF